MMKGITMISRGRSAEQKAPPKSDAVRPVAKRSQVEEMAADKRSVTSAVAQISNAVDRAAERIRLAWSRHEAKEALRRCKILRSRFPNEVTGYTLTLMILRETNQIEEAETLAEFALNRFANEPSFRIERAMLAFHRRNWDEAIRRFAALRQAFPQTVEGYLHGIMALREAGRLEDAEVLAKEGIERFRGEVGLAVEHVWIACAQQNWPEALRRSQELQDNFPDHAEGFTLGMMALREMDRIEEAETLAESARERFPEEISFHLQRALLASHRRDWGEAIQRFMELRENFPQMPEGYVHGISALREAKRLEEAEAWAEEGNKRFSGEVGLAVEHVWIAYARQDWPEALRRCQRLQENFPDHAAGFTLGVMVLREMDRITEAQALASSACSRFLDAAALWLERALLSIHRADWLEAIKQLEEVQRRFPNTAEAYAYGSLALRSAGQFDRAEEVVESGLRVCPRAAQLWVERGMIAMARRDFLLAAERWAVLRSAFPHQVEGYLYGVQALREIAQLEASEVLAEAAMSRFPDQSEFVLEHALIASARQDLPEAQRRWKLVAERFPNDPAVLAQIYQLKLDALEETAAAPVVLAEVAENPNEPQDLLLSFEGLGDNCEFGNVQRHFGAEPLGLLRWAGISPHDLIRGLETRFAGYGDPQTTKVWISEPAPGYAGGEYYIRDVEHGFYMHCFVSVRDVKEEKFLQQTCRRMNFLREKLLSDLASGDKIFVYKRRDGTPLTEDELFALNAGVRSYGPSTLLCVHLADETHPNGLVDQVREGLLLGYIDRLCETANGTLIAYESWLHLCRAARALVPVNTGARP
jgi:tetratricopeptide (TPR) repeat protein